MAEIEIPGPKREWEPAVRGPCPGRNPALQQSLLVLASRNYRLVACLRVPMEAVVQRLRLTLEHGWDDLGEVEGAGFGIKGVKFMVSRLMYPDQLVELAVERSYEDVDGAVDLFLGVLGADRRALSYLMDLETGCLEPVAGPR
ncbi:hypothetical protein ACFYST_33425 [Kitasatospora sp. NPDC004614]|uniref:hypothetical protein n=1 Tax=unclassified Kitasatospora TaxID=2633591 RepID=UPI0036A56F7B